MEVQNRGQKRIAMVFDLLTCFHRFRQKVKSKRQPKIKNSQIYTRKKGERGRHKVHGTRNKGKQEYIYTERRRDNWRQV